MAGPSHRRSTRPRRPLRRHRWRSYCLVQRSSWSLASWPCAAAQGVLSGDNSIGLPWRAPTCTGNPSEKRFPILYIVRARCHGRLTGRAEARPPRRSGCPGSSLKMGVREAAPRPGGLEGTYHVQRTVRRGRTELGRVTSTLPQPVSRDCNSRGASGATCRLVPIASWIHAY